MTSFNHNTYTPAVNGLNRCVTLCAKHVVAIIGRVFMLTTWPRKCP